MLKKDSAKDKKQNINKKGEDKETESFMAYMDEKEREEAELETCFPDIEEEEETCFPFYCYDEDTGELDEEKVNEYIDSIKSTKTVEKKKITIDKDYNITIEKTTERSAIKKNGNKKERILPEGQRDLEGNDVSNINFGGLVTRNVMRATYKILENYLILFPRYGFKNEISGMILYGPNGTGKTEFCNSIMIRQEFAKYCDFEKVDIYNLIDSKMGATSEKVANKFKEWINIYKKKNRIQVKIIDEGELVFLQKKDRGSKAYSELSNSMLKHTGKFNGIFIILITNDLEYLNKGAISRFDRIYWPPLDVDERLNFMRYKLENSGIKVDMTNLNKLSNYLDKRFGDIRTHNKFISDFKGWFVRSREVEDVEESVDEKDLIPLMVDFNKKMDGDNGDMTDKEVRYNREVDREVVYPNNGFIYPDSEEEMIDYLIKFSKSHLKKNWVEFKERWEMKGCVGNQLEYHVKPSYRKLRIAIENR